MRVVLATVVPLMIVEGLLDAGAWAARRWMNTREVHSGAKSRRTVLCVGDSYTFGLGASDSAHAYPGQLERRLREAAVPPWTIVNAGWPGRDSADVLRELPAQLDEHAPAFVCILAGMNDRWNHPRLCRLVADPDAPDHREPLLERLRIVRLAKLVVAALRRPEQAAAAPAPVAPPSPFIGKWVDGDRIFILDGDGRAFVRDVDGRWNQRGDTLRIELPGQAAEDLTFTVVDDRLRLSTHDGVVRFDCVKAQFKYMAMDADCQSPDQECAAASQLLYANDFVHAAAALGNLLPRFPESVSVRSGLAQALGRLGRFEEAAPHVLWLKQRYAAEPTRSVAELFCWALFAAAPGKPGVDELKRLAAGQPECLSVHRALAQRAHDVDDIPAARVAINRAVELAPADDLLLRGHLIRNRARFLKDGEPKASLRDVATAYRIDGDRDDSIQLLRIMTAASGTPALRGWAAELGLDDPGRRQLDALITDAAAGNDSMADILSSHLRQMIELCRRRGAQPLIVGYPEPLDYCDLANVRAHDATGAPLVRIADVFKHELERRPRAEIFVTDGHCTDVGYGIVADHVAAKLRELASAR